MPSDEHTPLITIVRVAPRQQRYTHSTLRRFCTIALGTTLIVVVILFLLPVALLPHGYEHRHGRAPFREGDPPFKGGPWSSSDSPEVILQNDGLLYKELQDVLLNTPKEEKAREWSEYYTAGPHLAGKNLSQAIWTRDRWQEFGVQNTEIVSYDIYINYPLGHRLALLEKVAKDIETAPGHRETSESSYKDYKISYECSLEEDVLEEDRTSGLPNRIPTFHGYSASGNITAPFVYVNFGTYQDFEDLVKANISLAGNIAIAKYGKIFRGLKVKRAEELGMLGVVIYSDPQEDGDITEENGHKAYPNGPARNPSSVQRGSTQYLSKLSLQGLVQAYNDTRYSTWRSDNARISIKTRCASSGPSREHSFYPFSSHLVPGRSSHPQSPQWPRPQSFLLQQILARRRPRLQRRTLQHRSLPLPPPT